jgi:hypothetical protein
MEEAMKRLFLRLLYALRGRVLCPYCNLPVGKVPCMPNICTHCRADADTPLGLPQ